MGNKQLSQLIQSRVSLAPMAGVTDLVLRDLVREYSKTCLITTEMISSELLNQKNRETDMTDLRDNHHPIAFQVSGHKPDLIRKSAVILSPMCDIFDINMGCPVKKVVGGNDGSALMRTPELAQELVRAAKEGTEKPVSVKFRLGYTADEMNFVEFGQMMQEAGADFITIHGRTRSQMYSGHADWKRIRDLVRNVDIPVFANGDVVSVETAIQCLEESEADGVAIGRGVLGDPTLIHRVEHYLRTGEKLEAPTLNEKIDMLIHHLQMEIDFRGVDIGVKFMRKFFPYYISGVKNAAKIRAAIVLEDDPQKIIETLNLLRKAELERV
ncbi:MAG: tRNA dihydrouridine synthase DusB [Fusobacterium sp.]|nr:tRNA dihydrouridine synthase DusB [Fusobacterium sp.]